MGGWVGESCPMRMLHVPPTPFSRQHPQAPVGVVSVNRGAMNFGFCWCIFLALRDCASYAGVVLWNRGAMARACVRAGALAVMAFVARVGGAPGMSFVLGLPLGLGRTRTMQYTHRLR